MKLHTARDGRGEGAHALRLGRLRRVLVRHVDALKGRADVEDEKEAEHEQRRHTDTDLRPAARRRQPREVAVLAAQERHVRHRTRANAALEWVRRWIALALLVISQRSGVVGQERLRWPPA